MKTIQIMGTKKCKETKKALRFFKERGIKPHEVDLAVKGISPGEVDSILRSVPPDELMDQESPLFQKEGYAYRDYDPREEVIEKPLLLKTPVVRFEGKATLGYHPETWKEWLAR